MSDTLLALRDLALDVATEAALLLHDGRPARVAVAATKSSATDVVTEMDRASERLLVTRILAARPDDGILGEEGSERAGTSGVRWVVDPLDGTVDYLYGQPVWAVSVGVEIDGVAAAGAVVAPELDRTWWAVRGGGAWRRTADGDRRLAVNDPVPLDRALVATGFGYVAARRGRQGRVVAEVLPRVRDIRRLGAAAVELCLLGEGASDAFYEQGLSPWDRSAGGLVAAEAGALVSGLHGRPADEAMTLAAGPALHPLLATLLEDLGADRD